MHFFINENTKSSKNKNFTKEKSVQRIDLIKLTEPEYTSTYNTTLYVRPHKSVLYVLVHGTYTIHMQPNDH